MRARKHIGMWSCPRSRSTLVARAFERLEGCVVFDEPLYGPYLLTRGLNHPGRQECLRVLETDLGEVIRKITGDLPAGADFSFQKHLSKLLLPHFERDWLNSLANFFLIRHPSEIVASYRKILAEPTAKDIGMRELRDIFRQVSDSKGEAALVIHSDDLIRDPERVLAYLCQRFSVKYSEEMLHWPAGLGGSSLMLTGELRPLAETWYATVTNSTGFIPQERRKADVPEGSAPLVEELMPYYEQLLRHRVAFDV
jgi:Sulfotransferase domain